MNKQLKQILPHVQVGLADEGHAVLVVADAELADFIDDYLGEQGLSCAYLTLLDRQDGQIVSLHFSASVAMEEIETCLASLSVEEVERIYRLNN